MPWTEVKLTYLSQLTKLDKDQVKLNIKLGLVKTGISGTKELKVLNTEEELRLVGVIILNAKKLQVLNFREAMKDKDTDKWTEKIAKERELFDEYNVVTSMKWTDFPKGAKVLLTTWAMKTDSLWQTLL